MLDSIPHNSTATSILAADSKRGSAMSDEAYVETYFKSQGLIGSTIDQAEMALGMSHQSLSARANSLAGKFRILLVGEIRRTRSNRMAQVYVHRDHLDAVTANALENTMREMERMRRAKQLQRLQTESQPAGA